VSIFSFTIIYSTPPSPVLGVSSGGWGTGEWGTGPWGASQAAPPQINSALPNVVDELGGTVVLITGSNFNARALVELLQGTQVVGQASISDLQFDLTPSKLYVGMPVLETGFYSLRVTTNGGLYTLDNAIEARPFAYELKTEDVRRKWGRAWNLGVRQLSVGG